MTTNEIAWRSVGLLAMAVSLGWAGGSGAQTAPKESTKGAGMASRGKGTFEVKLTPDTAPRKEDSLASGRLTFSKSWQGDLSGTSQGEMWTTDTAVKGSAGYVAIEKFSGSLGGRSGSFTLLHHATMSRGGDFKIAIDVVPDSGTDQLTGLSGTLAIRIVEGKHFYDFDYSLAGVH